jgi:hypothetical protein
MSEGSGGYPESEIPKVFREDKKPNEKDVQDELIRQTTNARSRTLDYDDDPESLGQDWPALKGHEEKLLQFANSVAMQQPSEVAEIPSSSQTASEPQPPASTALEEGEEESEAASTRRPN